MCRRNFGKQVLGSAGSSSWPLQLVERGTFPFALQENFRSWSLLSCSVTEAGVTHWFRLRFGQKVGSVSCLERGQIGRNRNICLGEAENEVRAGRYRCRWVTGL